MQRISNKMIKLTPPKTILSFRCEGSTVETIIDTAEDLFDTLLIERRSVAAGPQTESLTARVLHCTTDRNTWSRAARRALARGSTSGSKAAKEVAESVLSPVVLEFDVRVSSTSQSTSAEPQLPSTPQSATVPDQASHTIEFTWTVGEDRDLFESCFLHFRSKFQQDHAIRMQKLTNKIQAP